MIWEQLLCVAKTGVDVEQAVGKVMAGLEWDRLEEVSEEMRGWFNRK